MAQSNPKLKEIREFIYVAQPPDRPVYAVKTIYQETDAINAVGQVCDFLQKPGGIVRCERTEHQRRAREPVVFTRGESLGWQYRWTCLDHCGGRLGHVESSRNHQSANRSPF